MKIVENILGAGFGLLVLLLFLAEYWETILTIGVIIIIVLFFSSGGNSNDDDNQMYRPPLEDRD